MLWACVVFLLPALGGILGETWGLHAVAIEAAVLAALFALLHERLLRAPAP